MSARPFPLTFEECGAGAPLVLVHGMASDRHCWDGVWLELAVSRRVIRYDLRGFGESSGSVDEPYSHGADLLALLDHLGIAHADVLGVSMGGSIALHFALDHPARVNRLMLVSPSMKGWDWSDEWRALEAKIEQTAREGGVVAARVAWLDHPLFATLSADQRRALAAEVARYSGRHWLGPDAHILPLAPDIERLDQVNAPTLLITGGRDVLDLRLIAETMVAMIRDIRRVDVAEAGHLIHSEAPARFLAEVDAFLS